MLFSLYSPLMFSQFDCHIGVAKLQRKAISFFYRFVMADCEKIAIENPIGIMSSCYRKPNQIINPYEFGETECKSTCLWLKGLSNLKPTKIIPKDITKEVRSRLGVIQYDLDGNEINKFPSVKAAAIAMKCDPKNISRVCKKENNRKTACGYKWEYDYTVYL